MNPTLIVSLFAAGWLAQQAPSAKPVSANFKVRISTSTYMPDGRVLSASASDWPLRLNEAITAYATSGKTLCEPKAASTQEPALPAIGWRLEITPVREGAGELEVRVQWRQLGMAKRVASARLAPLGPGATLTLHAGDRVVLDYTTGARGGLFVFGREGQLGYQQFKLGAPKEAIGAPASQPSGCAALGMSLEIGLEPAKTEALVEAELWLVRPNKDGTERSDRQVLRLPVGQPASRYFFDEARLAGSTTGNDAFAKVSGELSAVSIENGKIRLHFNVMRKYGKSTEADTSSTYRDLVAVPGEVLAFQLPAAAAKEQPLSIRLRANVMR